MTAAAHGMRFPPSRSRVSAPGLVMTDHLVVLSLMLAAFWVLDPFRVNLDRIPVVKHFPLMTLLGALTLAAVGAKLFPRTAARAKWKEIWGAFWVMGLFALVVIGGSLFARFQLGIVNTFLNMGLFLLPIPLLARSVCTIADPVTWSRNYFFAVGAIAACDGVLEWATFGSGNSFFHGAEFVVIPVAVYLWFAKIPVLLRILGVLLFLSFGVAVHKNTGYLVLLFTVSYCIFWSLRARYRMVSDPMVRERYVALSLFSVLGLGLLIGAFFLVRELIAPGGNVEYRIHTYERALTKFTESPIFGNLFTGAATEKFDLFDVLTSVSNVLPTHSDPLDILANGGLIFSAVFAYGIWKLLRPMFSAIEAAPNSTMENCVPALHTSVAVFISGLLTMAFNPVMTQPNSALILWTTTGVGLGLALYVKHAARILG